MAEKITKTNEPRFTADELAASAKFAKRRDLVKALLRDGTYTVAEAEAKIKEYLERRVR